MALSFEEFQYGFVNTWPEDDARAAYDRYPVPETGRIFFRAGTASLNPHAATAIDFHDDDRAPLLLIAGENDNASPPSVTRATARKYDRSHAITDFHEFAGRSHLLIAGEGRQEVADYAEDWADRALTDQSPPPQP